jgi:predicted phage gp36 major capsid-like protein
MLRCPPETKIALAREKVRALQEMKNSGNEAKKSLKTKDSARNLRAIRAQINTNCASKRAKTPHSAQNEAKPDLPQSEAWMATSCRLHKGHFSPAKAAAGAVRADCTAFLGLPLRDIADPKPLGSAPTETAWLKTES